MGDTLDCREFEKLIPGFIGGKLDYQTLKLFREHYDACADCREELVIQLLVTEGLARLEEGGAFDLPKELNRRLRAADVRLRRGGNLLNFGAMLEAVAMASVIVAAMWIILN